MPLDLKPNQDFLKFIAIQGEKKNFQNLETLLNLERNYPGMFVKVIIMMVLQDGWRNIYCKRKVHFIMHLFLFLG